MRAAVAALGLVLGFCAFVMGVAALVHGVGLVFRAPSASIGWFVFDVAAAAVLYVVGIVCWYWGRA